MFLLWKESVVSEQQITFYPILEESELFSSLFCLKKTGYVKVRVFISKYSFRSLISERQ